MSQGAIVVDAARIRAVFERHNDRWEHRIELIGEAGAPTVIMKSLEGSPDERWPPSPAIQELQSQTQADGTVSVSGIGMAGKCHWSLSCNAILLDKARTMGGLTFHVACRTTEEFQRIGSCYHIVPESTACEFENGLHYRSSRAEWMVASDVENIRDANYTLRMDVFGIGAQTVPRTVEWGYLIDPRGPYG